MTRRGRFLDTIMISALSVSCLALLTVSRASAGSKPDLTCRWRDREVVIDGESTEWEGTFVAIEKPGFVMGLMNDDEFLYVCLIPQGRETRSQMLHLGFTVWFDPAGGKEKVLGIGFPLGAGAGPGGMRMSPGGGLGTTEREEGVSESERLQQLVQQANSEMEIVVPALGERHRIPVRVAEGILVKVNADETRLVYEAKIPLIKNQDHPHAVGAEVGRVIGVQMETTELRFDEKSQRGMGGPPPGGGRGAPGGAGMPGGGGFGPGGGGPMVGGAGRPTPPKPVKLHLSVQLATREQIPR